MESIEKTKALEVEVLQTLSDADWEQIAQLERQVFDWGLSDEDLEMTHAIAAKEQSVVVVARGDEAKIVGYVIGCSNEDAIEDLGEEDEGFEPRKNTLYVFTTAIDQNHRGGRTFYRMLSDFSQAAKAKGYDRIAAHSPDSHLEGYGRRIDLQPVRTFEDWCDSGEPHTYWEASLE
mgnify:CR=1 FL=1